MNNQYPQRYDRLSSWMTFVMSLEQTSFRMIVISTPFFMLAGAAKLLTRSLGEMPIATGFTATAAALSMACSQHLIAGQAAKVIHGLPHSLLFRKAHQWGKTLGYAAPGALALTFAAISAFKASPKEEAPVLRPAPMAQCPPSPFRIDDDHNVTGFSGYDWKCNMLTIRKP